MSEEHSRYLGDGVYASYDGYHIWLRTDRYGTEHKIALEPHVLYALSEYVMTLQRQEHDKPKEDQPT